MVGVIHVLTYGDNKVSRVWVNKSPPPLPDLLHGGHDTLGTTSRRIVPPRRIVLRLAHVYGHDLAVDDVHRKALTASWSQHVHGARMG